MANPVFLSRRDVEGTAEPAEAIAAVKDAYRQRGEGAPTQPRTALRRRDPDGLFNTYIALLPETGVMGGYIYAAGFSDGDAWLLAPLFDADSGRPLALLDGASMNTMKTGAAGAVGIDALARPNSDILAVIGSGAQARAQVLAAATVRELSEVRVFSPTRAHREALVADLRAVNLNAQASGSSNEATAGADIIVTATNADNPVVDSAAIDDGTHINAIGQYHPEKQEIDIETIHRSTYVPDLRRRVVQDAGSFLAAMENGAITKEHIHAELGDIIAGSASGRCAADEVTMFDSGGTAIETTAVAALLYQKAMERGTGSDTLPFTSASETYTGKRGSSAEEL